MNAPYPLIVVQLSTREKVKAFRAGLADAQGVVALGLDESSFRRLAGIDALYLSITRAERWGGSPPLPHTAALLETTEAEQREGMPKHVLTGLVLKDDEPNTAAFCLPLLLKATRDVIGAVNAKTPAEPVNERETADA
jgi:hypothetical protein